VRPYLKNTYTKRAGGVVQGVGLSSSPGTKKIIEAKMKQNKKRKKN
jgi:hypothetical protein